LRRSIAWLLPCLAVAALTGILVADTGWLTVPSACGLAIGSAGAAVVARRRPAVLAICAAVIFMALGGAGHARQLALAERDAPRGAFDAVADATVRALRRERAWVAMELHDVVAVPFAGGPVAGLPARLQLIEPADTPEGLWLAGRREGDRIRARFRLTPSGGLRNPGSPDRGRRSRRRGIGGEARLLDARLATWLRGPASPGTRASLSERLRGAGPGGGLLAALALGDRFGIQADAREAFRRLGIGHLLVVSGLHLALVAALGFTFVRRTAVRVPVVAEASDVRVWACVAAAVAALGYAALAGWGVPVRRATVFVLFTLVALGLRRGAAPAHTVSAAVLGIALFDPSATFEMGAQLSFVATAALLWDRHSPDSGWRNSLRVSATAIAATAPVLAAHGVASTPMGLLANLAAVPWTGIVLLPISLLAAGLGALDACAPVDWLLAMCASIAQMSLEGVVRVAEWVPPSRPVARIGWVGLAVATGIAAASVTARRTSLRVLLAALVSTSTALAPAPAIGPEPPRVVALDVGLGDAILVEGRGAAILVDGGWGMAGAADLGRSVVLPALRALGVERLDVIVATHADLDHSGGLSSVLEGLPVGELWVPAGRGHELDALNAVAVGRGVTVREQDARTGAIRVGDLAIEILWPAAEAVGRGRNDSSLVLRIEVAGTRILLTGDVGESVERALLASGIDLGADVLKLPHHGSRWSSTLPFLEAVGAEIGLLSAPCSTRSRLPTRETFERARSAGLPLWWTGRDGAVWVQLYEAPVRRVVWGWQRDPNCRLPASRAALRRT